MIADIHKRAIEMWVLSKLNDSKTNPSSMILEHLIGQNPILDAEPENTVQLCQKINEINGLEDLTDDEKTKIQKYGIQIVENNQGSKNRMLTKSLRLTWLNWIGYVLGAISIAVGDFSWWLIGFGIGTRWAHGARKMAAQKQNHEPGPAWEMPVHITIHFIALLGLIGFSIFNMI